MPTARRIIQLADWPAHDRRLWLGADARVDPFIINPPVLAPATLQKWAKGYGRWLAFLRDQGWLEPEIHPADRITPERLDAYFGALQISGNADHTIIGRFSELCSAMRRLAPDRDMGWIRRPYGLTVYSVLPRRRKMFTPPDSRVLYRWGLRLMDSAGRGSAVHDQLIQYRDGLLIAILAARGRRVRAMAGLRIGKELVRVGDTYRIELPSCLNKTGVPDDFGLPADLTSYIEHYLATTRPALLKTRSDALWISARGRPLSQKGIQEHIARLSHAHFGIAFRPHRFRHAIATTAALQMSDHNGLASGVLNISPSVVDAHYNRANQVEATLRFQAMLDSEHDGGPPR